MKEQSIPFLTYPLQDGYIDYWLVLDPAPDTSPADFSNGYAQLIARREQALSPANPPDLPFSRTPREMDRLADAFWQAESSAEDHLLERGQNLPRWQHLRRWLFTELRSPANGVAVFHLRHTARCRLWLNGALAYTSADLPCPGDQQLQSHSLPVNLRSGNNPIWILLEEITKGPALLALSAALEGAGLEGIRIRLRPANPDLETRALLQGVFDTAHLSQTVYRPGDIVQLSFGQEANGKVQGVMRVQGSTGAILGESIGEFSAGSQVQNLASVQLPTGPLQVRLTPPHQAYYNAKLRAQRSLPFLNAPLRPVTTSAGTFESRAAAAIQSTAVTPSLLGQLARTIQNPSQAWDPTRVRAACAGIENRQGAYLSDLLGLTSLLLRSSAPDDPQDLQALVKSLIIGFAWQEGAHPQVLSAWPAETTRLYLLVSQLLAGQLCPASPFASLGLSGEEACAQAEDQLATLLERAVQQGWEEGYGFLEERVAALTHLIDFAGSSALQGYSLAALDQLFFSLAQNSFRGSLCTPGGSLEQSSPLTGRLHPSNNLHFLLFGTGFHAAPGLGTLALAATTNYQLPELITAIAQDEESSLWSQETLSSANSPAPRQLSLWKTPSYLLASSSSPLPDDQSNGEFLWQAVLGPEARVFTNHPVSLNSWPGREAGLWQGNASLPRLAQHQGSLICLHSSPPGCGLPWTHAYFPVFAFDEVHAEKEWYFARSGQGYLGLWCSSGLTLTTAGAQANHELRAQGRQAVWLVQVGSQQEDGSFDDFIAKTTAQPPLLTGLDVRWTTIRGNLLEFGWERPLTVDGSPNALHPDLRYRGPFVHAPFPATTMDIAHGTQMMRLNLRYGEE